jgi:hypothetical protein
MEHKCRFCEKTFETGQKLGCHIRVHNRLIKQCPVCEKSYDQRKIEQHIVECLTRFNSFNICEFCKSKTKSERFCSKSCANRSRSVSKETKEKIRNSIHARFPKREIPCKHCGSIFVIDRKQRKRNVCNPICDRGKEFKSKQLSKSLKGKTGGYRIGGGRGHGGYVDGMWMDSTWEIELAKKLNDLSIAWERDTGKHRLTYVDTEGSVRNYFPDFYLPDFNTYIEVKGYWTSETKQKMNSVIERNEQVRIIILESLEEIKNFTLAGVPE